MVGEEAEIVPPVCTGVLAGNSFAERVPRRLKLEIFDRKRALT